MAPDQMKTIKVTLRQADGGQFQVEKFTNTVQLSIGQLIPHATVAEWCVKPFIQIECVGMVQQDDEQALLTDAPAKPARHDALSLSESHDANNPF